MEPDDIELYALALAESSLLEAWQFQRTFHESNEVRPRLMQKLLEWCVARTYYICRCCSFFDSYAFVQQSPGLQP